MQVPSCFCCSAIILLDQVRLSAYRVEPISQASNHQYRRPYCHRPRPRQVPSSTRATASTKPFVGHQVAAKGIPDIANARIVDRQILLYRSAALNADQGHF